MGRVPVVVAGLALTLALAPTLAAGPATAAPATVECRPSDGAFARPDGVVPADPLAPPEPFAPVDAHGAADQYFSANRSPALTVYRGDPALFDDLDAAPAVCEAVAAGDLHRWPNVSDGALHDLDGVALLPGELLVLELQAPAVADAYADTEGPNATARFRSLLGTDLVFRVLEPEAATFAHEDPDRFRLDDFARWTVVPDADDDTYYVVVDTGAGLDPTVSGETFNTVHGEFEVVATVRATGESGRAAFEFVGPAVAVNRVEFGGDEYLQGSGDAVVTGTSNLLAGTPLVVRLDENGSGGATLQRRVRVGEQGRFAAFADANVTPGAPVSVVVRANATTHRLGGTVQRVHARAGPSAFVHFAGERGDVRFVDTVRVSTVQTTAGGFVVVRRGSADGPVVNRSAYLPPGYHTAVPVEVDVGRYGNVTLVATVRRDADADRAFDPASDPRYPHGSPSATAQFVDMTVALPPAPTPTTTGTRPPGTAPTPGTQPAGDPVPGFGPAVALVALAGAALVATGRGGRRPGG